MKEFVCLRCGACCRLPGGFVHVTEEDIRSMSQVLRIREEEFIETWTDLAPNRQGLVLKNKPDDACCFLDDSGSCRVHEGKPEQCKRFPHSWRNPDSHSTCAGLRALAQKQPSKKEHAFSELAKNSVPLPENTTLPLPQKICPLCKRPGTAFFPCEWCEIPLRGSFSFLRIIALFELLHALPYFPGRPELLSAAVFWSLILPVFRRKSERLRTLVQRAGSSDYQLFASATAFCAALLLLLKRSAIPPFWLSFLETPYFPALCMAGMLLYAPPQRSIIPSSRITGVSLLRKSIWPLLLCTLFCMEILSPLRAFLYGGILCGIFVRCTASALRKGLLFLFLCHFTLCAPQPHFFAVLIFCGSFFSCAAQAYPKFREILTK